VEKAMLPTTRFGGHIVSGHVDAVGEITVVREDARSLYFEVTAPAEIARYLAEKGSITVDGISLTINHLRGRILSLNLIPHTAERTNIGTWKAGSQVNLEVDVLARYIERLMMGDKAAETTPQSKISLDFLAQNGFLK
jgi:riboflavin synthase